jgi:hypothetical protein
MFRVRGNRRISGRAVVAMVQTTQSRMADHRTGGCRTDSAARRFLAEAKMGAVGVMIRRVRGEKPLEVVLVQRDDVVEQIAPAAAYPAFRNAVLPGALDRGLHGRDLQGAKGSGYFQAIFLVVIEEQESGSGFVRKGFLAVARSRCWWDGGLRSRAESAAARGSGVFALWLGAELGSETLHGALVETD